MEQHTKQSLSSRLSISDISSPDAPTTTNNAGGSQSDIPVRFDLIDGKAMFAMAKVLDQGAKKYTIYGECTCVNNVVSENNMPENYVESAMIDGSKKTILDTSNDKQQTPQLGWKKDQTKDESIENDIIHNQSSHLVKPRRNMGLLLRNIWRLLVNHVDYVELQKPPDMSTITTQQDISEEQFATDVTLDSASLKKEEKIGQLKHLPGCLALTIIKPGEGNWRLIDIESHLNHLLMHTYAYLAGDRTDDHLSHILCRATFANGVALKDEETH